MNLLRAAVVVALLATTGIGCSSQRRMGTVEGEVTFDGKPLKYGTVLFEVPGAGLAHGEIEDGKLVNVTTIEPGDGVPVGEASVAIRAMEILAPKSKAANATNETGGVDLMAASEKNLLPGRYANPATSGLTAKIEPGVNVLKFDLQK